MITFDDYYSNRTLVAATFGSLAVVLRMGPLGVNKYVLWIGLGMVWWYIRTSRVVSSYNSMFWLTGMVIMRAMAFLMGWYKRSKAPEEMKSTFIGNLVVGTHVALFAYLYIFNFVARWY